MSCVCPTAMAELYLFQASCQQWLTFPVVGKFGPSVVNGQMWGCPELEWGQTRHLSELQ